MRAKARCPCRRRPVAAERAIGLSLRAHDGHRASIRGLPAGSRNDASGDGATAGGSQERGDGGVAGCVVLPPNLHITLKFLGETDAGLIDVLGGALATVAGKHAPFRVDVVGVSVLPEYGDPRLLVTSIDRGHERLAALANDVDAALFALGIAKATRPFCGPRHAGPGETGSRGCRGGEPRSAVHANGQLWHVAHSGTDAVPKRSVARGRGVPSPAPVPARDRPAWPSPGPTMTPVQAAQDR